MGQDILISVIVPVYNVAPFLGDCVDSIIRQTYKNLEIILVDDGSTDLSGKICDDYAAKDSRIKVIHQPNAGLSAARNTGHRAATGDYLCFVDSDDYLSVFYCEKLLPACLESGADMALCGYTEAEESSSFRPGTLPRGHWSVETIDCRDYSMRIYTKAEMTYVCAWNKLYRRELIKGLEYPPGRLNEDLGMMPLLLPRLSAAAVTGMPLYLYRDRKNSISRVRTFNPKKTSILPFTLQLIDFFEGRGWQDIKYMAMRDYLVSCMEFYSLADKNKPEEKEWKDKMLKEYRSMLKKAFKNPASSKRFLLKMERYRFFPDSYIHGRRGRILYGLEVNLPEKK